MVSTQRTGSERQAVWASVHQGGGRCSEKGKKSLGMTWHRRGGLGLRQAQRARRDGQAEDTAGAEVCPWSLGRGHGQWARGQWGQRVACGLSWRSLWLHVPSPKPSQYGSHGNIRRYRGLSRVFPPLPLPHLLGGLEPRRSRWECGCPWVWLC